MGKPWKSRPYVESTKMEALIGNSHRLLIGGVDPAGRDSVLPAHSCELKPPQCRDEQLTCTGRRKAKRDTKNSGS